MEITSGPLLALFLLAVGQDILRGKMVFSVPQFFRASADDDPAAPGLGQRPGGVGVELDRIGGGGGNVDAGKAAQLAFGDLADEGVVEDELGTERGVAAETGERLVKILLPGLRLLRFDWVLAALQPTPDAVDRMGGADQGDGDLTGSGRGVGVGRAEHADAVAGIDVTVSGAEL
ncbi:hypothetical protein [Streptomyces sp. bgisy022]|uniref:hypothetical protein n=1 Tax=Streptomyces sp. bgisy022 TaxID=3413769 RepID=UPI003D72F3AF